MYVAPSFGSIRFSCPHCGAFAHQFWLSIYGVRLEKDKSPFRHDREKLLEFQTEQKKLPPNDRDEIYSKLSEFIRTTSGDVFLSPSGTYVSSSRIYNLEASRCDSCGDIAVWLANKMVYPGSGPAGLASKDMPDVVRSLYDEAGAVFTTSPRAAAALLRLALQHLLRELGEPGKDINTDINSLIDKGLDDEIAKQMHALRIVGNESVHPGQIDVNDEPYIAEVLFELLNQIVDQMITKPRKREELWSRLPEGKRKHVEERLAKRKASS